MQYATNTPHHVGEVVAPVVDRMIDAELAEPAHFDGLVAIERDHFGAVADEERLRADAGLDGGLAPAAGGEEEKKR